MWSPTWTLTGWEHLFACVRTYALVMRGFDYWGPKMRCLIDAFGGYSCEELFR
jgi:hypothetical protein